MKTMQIKSPAFVNNGKIPSIYTCDGEDVNPPLEFENVPEEATSLSLIVTDPDAPGKTWVHWMVFNISPHVTKIYEDSVPSGSFIGMSDFGNANYGGPCPPKGVHRYVFSLYALDKVLDMSEDTTRVEAENAMEGHIIEQAQLIGLYTRE